MPGTAIFAPMRKMAVSKGAETPQLHKMRLESGRLVKVKMAQSIISLTANASALAKAISGGAIAKEIAIPMVSGSAM